MDSDAFTTNEELALLVDAVQDYAIFMLSPAGHVRSWNRGAQRIFGYRADEARGLHFSTFYPEEAIAARKPERELEEAAAHGRVEDEGWRRRSDGQLFWVNTVITALRDEDGSIHGFAKVTRDLTERRLADEKVRQSEEMFRLLVTSVEEYAIFMLDPTGHVMSWNGGARRIKQYEPEQIIGRHFSVFYPIEDRWKTEVELEIASRDSIVEDEGWRVRRDGTRFWANVVITAVHDEAGHLRGFAKVTRDLTERRESELTRQALIEQREARLQAEEKRRLAETSFRASQESNRLKDEFLMTLSHELRTPMTSILGWSRIVCDLPQAEPMVREAAQAIARSAQHQARLIDDVLDLSSVVAGKMRLEPRTVDLIPLLEDAIHTVAAAAEAKGITIERAFGRELGSVVVDPIRLQQVVWNLLTNAVKFTPRGGTVILAAGRTASRLEITVEDSGEGIDPAFMPHIFEPFRQAESSSTRSHGGLGLGLSIVRYLTEAHGGSITASSEGKGRGASFRITLPIPPLQPSASDGEPYAVRDPAPGSASRPRIDGVSILLVDDDDDGRAFLRVTLAAAGASVTDVPSVESAQGELRDRPFDIIISDIAMPGTDGFTFARELRGSAHWPRIALIALTAFPPSAVEPRRAEFDAVLLKPVEPVTLLDEIVTQIKRSVRQNA